jgi:hypothetical protein
MFLSPTNPKVKKAADKLTMLVAKYGKIMEVITRRNSFALTSEFCITFEVYYECYKNVNPKVYKNVIS